MKLLILQGIKLEHPNLIKIFDWAKTQSSFQTFYLSSQTWGTGELQVLAKNHSDIDALVIPLKALDELRIALEHFSKIKWIVIQATGIDVLRPLFPILKERQIKMSNQKGSSAILLAEYAIFGLLFFEKQAYQFIAQHQKKEWVPYPVDIGYLHGKKAMIVGLGSIGQEIARKLYFGFGVKSIGVKREVSSVPEDVKPCLLKVVSLEEVRENLKEVDYVIFSLPNINKGYILNEALLDHLNPGVLVVNVGRGDVVSNEAVIKGIKKGIIRGAAMDVWEEEPLPENSEIYQDPLIQDKILNFCHKADNGSYLSRVRVQNT